MKYAIVVAGILLIAEVALFVAYFFASRKDLATWRNIGLLKTTPSEADAQEKMLRLQRKNKAASIIARYCVYLVIIGGAALVITIFIAWMIFFGGALLPHVEVDFRSLLRSLSVYIDRDLFA
ncbi:hypothetical protein HZC00_04740 [Candidatus Kaiserbacteria bacterium]|nr:hypothetical protein [Candidatus Kaiserbacteria bacterium]